MTVFIQIPENHVKKIEKYANKHNLSLQELFLDSVLKEIDSESEVGQFANLLTKYTEEETVYSFDELDTNKNNKKTKK